MTTILRTVFYDTFASGVSGVAPITKAGTPVADNLVAAVRAAAAAANVALATGATGAPVPSSTVAVTGAPGNGDVPSWNVAAGTWIPGPPQAASGFTASAAHGQQPRRGRVEYGKALKSSTVPAGNKPVVIYEDISGGPGIIQGIHLVIADNSDNSTPGQYPQEDAGLWAFYLDDETTPAFVLSTNDLLMHGYLADPFTTERVGRIIKGGSGSTGGFRFWTRMPYQSYAKVEFWNASANYDIAAGNFFCTVLASTGVQDSRSYVVVTNETQPSLAQTPPTVTQPVVAVNGFATLTIVGAGQLESLWASGRPQFTAGRSFGDGVTNSTTALTSATANFVAGDVGRRVTGAGIPANTFIQSRTSATAVVMTNAATASASGVGIALGDDRGWQESSFEFYVDGDTVPTTIETGLEDFAFGSYYLAAHGIVSDGSGTVAGYPAGTTYSPTGSGPQDNAAKSYYRFYPSDPIRFNTGLTIRIQLGKDAHIPMSSLANFPLSIFAGVWLDAPSTGNGYVPDTAATPLFSDPLAYAPGTLAAAYDLANFDGATTCITSTGGGTDNWAAPKNCPGAPGQAALPAQGYWVQVDVTQSAALSFCDAGLVIQAPAVPARATAGGRSRVRFRQESGGNDFRVNAMDDPGGSSTSENEVFYTQLSGRNLVNATHQIAWKVVGSGAAAWVTAYYRRLGASSWQPIGRYQPARTTTRIALATNNIGNQAKFANLLVLPLKTV